MEVVSDVLRHSADPPVKLLESVCSVAATYTPSDCLIYQFTRCTI